MILLFIYFVFTLGISGACSIFEAMLFSATPAFVESVAKSSKTGKILKHLKSNIDNSVGSILVINMFANTVGAAAVGAQFVEVFGEQWQGAVAIVMTLSVLYIAEIVPKTLGALYWKKLILPCCYPLIFFYYIAFPFVYVSRITTFFFRKKDTQKMSRDEILALMELAEHSGSLDALEMDILEHLMLQKSLFATDIMTPKHLIFALKEEESIAKALKEIQIHEYSRIPLYSQEQIHSVVLRQNILRANLANKGKDKLKSIAKEIGQVSANMQVMNLLRLFVMSKEHLFAVVDDAKEFVGIVSLEDTVNAILGVGDLKRH